MFKTIVNETVKFSTIVTDANSAIVDPTNGIKFLIKNPSGIVSTYVYGTAIELLKDSVGKYSINLALPLVGVYKYRWETATPAVSIEEGSLQVIAATVF